MADRGLRQWRSTCLPRGFSRRNDHRRPISKFEKLEKMLWILIPLFVVPIILLIGKSMSTFFPSLRNSILTTFIKSISPFPPVSEIPSECFDHHTGGHTSTQYQVGRGRTWRWTEYIGKMTVIRISTLSLRTTASKQILIVSRASHRAPSDRSGVAVA